jgi:hypothetical protein
MDLEQGEFRRLLFLECKDPLWLFFGPVKLPPGHSRSGMVLIMITEKIAGGHCP